MLNLVYVIKGLFRGINSSSEVDNVVSLKLEGRWLPARTTPKKSFTTVKKRCQSPFAAFTYVKDYIFWHISILFLNFYVEDSNVRVESFRIVMVLVELSIMLYICSWTKLSTLVLWILSNTNWGILDPWPNSKMSGLDHFHSSSKIRHVLYFDFIN